MRSNYKKIGLYVRQANQRNKDMAVTNLRGININKLFMPSVANTVGVDLSKYKVVSKHQFAFNPMHVGRDEMLPISMLDKDVPVIVSPAYVVFEIKDHEELDPEYLMMWCRRPEFDRNAWFTTDSSVRGGFSWSDFCDMELPVPSIEKQREIVREYNTIMNRIQLNEQMNQKLEETAQAIYKHWFVDFEFPISAEYAASIGKPELEGKPYKSSGGEMVFCEELDQEIPKGWQSSKLGELLASKGYIRGPFGSALKKDDMTTSGIPVYEQQHAIYDHREFRYFIDDQKFRKLNRFKVKQNDIVISCSGTIGKITIIREQDPIGVINQALLILRPDLQKISLMYLYYFLTSSHGNRLLVSKSGGSAQTNIAKRDEVESISILLPERNVILFANRILQVADKKVVILRSELNALINLKNMLLAKISVADNVESIAA